MWCIVNLPNGTQQAVKWDPKAIGQDCLEKVCKALGVIYVKWNISDWNTGCPIKKKYAPANGSISAIISLKMAVSAVAVGTSAFHSSRKCPQSLLNASQSESRSPRRPYKYQRLEQCSKIKCTLLSRMKREQQEQLLKLIQQQHY